MSTIDPAVSRRVAAAAAERGVRFVDAPVSGGTPRATDGTLAIMVGASPEDFQAALPALPSGLQAMLPVLEAVAHRKALIDKTLVDANAKEAGAQALVAKHASLASQPITLALLAGSTAWPLGPAAAQDERTGRGSRCSRRRRGARRRRDLASGLLLLDQNAADGPPVVLDRPGRCFD